MNVDFNIGQLAKVIKNSLYIFLKENAILFLIYIKVSIVYILQHIEENQKC